MRIMEGRKSEEKKETRCTEARRGEDNVNLQTDPSRSRIESQRERVKLLEGNYKSKHLLILKKKKKKKPVMWGNLHPTNAKSKRLICQGKGLEIRENHAQGDQRRVEECTINTTVNTTAKQNTNCTLVRM